MDNQKVECPSCEWVGTVNDLEYGEACPICGDHDVEIDETMLLYLEDNAHDTYPYKVEDLVHASREANKCYVDQFTPWDEDRLLIGDDDIEIGCLETGLSFYILDIVAEDSRNQVDRIIINLTKETNNGD